MEKQNKEKEEFKDASEKADLISSLVLKIIGSNLKIYPIIIFFQLFFLTEKLFSSKPL